MRYNDDVKIIRKDHEKKIVLISNSGPMTLTLIDAENDLRDILSSIQVRNHEYPWFFYKTSSDQELPVKPDLNSKLELIHETGSWVFHNHQFEIWGRIHKFHKVEPGTITLQKLDGLNFKLSRKLQSYNVKEFKDNWKHPDEIRQIVFDTNQLC